MTRSANARPPGAAAARRCAPGGSRPRPRPRRPHRPRRGARRSGRHRGCRVLTAVAQGRHEQGQGGQAPRAAEQQSQHEKGGPDPGYPGQRRHRGAGRAAACDLRRHRDRIPHQATESVRQHDDGGGLRRHGRPGPPQQAQEPDGDRPARGLHRCHGFAVAEGERSGRGAVDVAPAEERTDRAGAVVCHHALRFVPDVPAGLGQAPLQVDVLSLPQRRIEQPVPVDQPRSGRTMTALGTKGTFEPGRTRPGRGPRFSDERTAS